MKRAFAILSAAAVGLLLFLSSCEPSPDPGSLVEDMIVQTGFDNTVNFTSYATYSMPLDTIGQIYNVFPNDTIIIGEYAQVISRTVKNSIDKAGYTMVGRTQNPDWGVSVFIVRNYNVMQSVVYPRYAGYYSYPYVNVSATNSATLVIEILDLKNKDSQGRIKLIWTAYIGDVLTSSDSFQKSIEGVGQAFAQSPYIKK